MRSVIPLLPVVAPPNTRRVVVVVVVASQPIQTTSGGGRFLMSLSAIDILLVIALIGFGAFVQAGLGFGLGIVTTPFLILIDAKLVPGVVLSMVLLIGTLTILKDRRLIFMPELRWIWLGRIPGTAAGAFLIAHISVPMLSAILGLSVLIAVVLSLRTPHVARTCGRLTAVGAISGFMASTTAMGGPPVALIYQNRTQGHERINLAADMALGTLIALVALTLVGRFGLAELTLSVMLVPAGLVGFFLAVHLLPYLSAVALRRALLVLCSIAGALALVKGINDFLA